MKATMMSQIFILIAFVLYVEEISNEEFNKKRIIYNK